MSLGKQHDRVGLVVGIVISCLLLWKMKIIFSVSFLLGWLFALFVFSPDSDLRPKQRIGFWGVLLYPYALLFKHRGRSHSLLLGTLTRVLYLLLTALVLLFILQQMEVINIHWNSWWQDFIIYLQNYSWNKVEYRIPIAVYLGMFGADAVHIMLDFFSSVGKMLRRMIF